MTTSYPLAWPQGWPRTPARDRRNGKSQWASKGKPWTFDAARVALADELDKHEAAEIILSTNYELRLDGAPRAGGKIPSDVGVAVYFKRKGRPVVMARDGFDRAEENIRSLTLALEAMRAIDRHGGSMMMDRVFEGFLAIGNGKRPWREVFGYPPSQHVPKQALDARYRSLARERHPDHGGSEAAMAELNVAREDALAEISA